jgi:hypothetical protein
MASQRPDRAARPLLGALLGLCSLVPAVAIAQTSGRIDPTQFPPTELFRQLQLNTVACGRDNSPEPCQQARATADPLMDHPRLPASCKDTLWDIRERAVVVSKNSYERREALNRDATDLLVLCKPATKPVGSGSQPATPEPKKQGGLGGFLRGLGIGGGGQ